MKYATLGLIAVALLGTAGINSSYQGLSNPQVVIGVLQDPHSGAASSMPLAGLAARRFRALQVNAVISSGDLTVMASDPNADSLRSLIVDSLGGHVPLYGLPNNHDLRTDSPIGSYTAADSADPLHAIRRVIQPVDTWGNFSTIIGPVKIIGLANMFNQYDATAGRAYPCSVGTSNSYRYYPDGGLWWDPANYPNWGVPGSPVWQWVSSEIKGCAVPHCILLVGNLPHSIQGTTATGRWAEGQTRPTPTATDTTKFFDMVEQTTTALGYHITAVWGAHQHIAAVIGPTRNDSLVTWASGGIYYLIGPPCQSSHASETAAWDSVAGSTFPDTCRTSYAPSWQTYHWTPGNILAYAHSAMPSEGWKLPGYAVIRASWPRISIAMYDSSNVRRWYSGELAPR